MHDDVPDALKVQKDLLWGLYTDVRAHARHAELLRANATNVVIVVAVALIALITSDGHVRRDEVPVAVMILVVGLFGLAFAASYTELYHRNRLRAEKIRTHLDAQFFDPGGLPMMTTVLEESDQDHEASRLYRSARRLTGSTHRFWRIAPGLVVVAGIALIAIAL